ncbi:energy-coupling factor ABC transporter ATP-binding protein [Anaerobacillus sp. MEB173]|uniref:energy-coupling factor ABC transporter ATP-binding protein n=1 Tax=Anaerobacillus sp. MEB173 TaxID=3383345 RepID=UPI003F92F79A
MKELIKVANLSFQYDEGDEWALQGINLSVYKGEWLAIVGHNGSGKSTLAKLLNGLLLPQHGSVVVEGFRTTEMDELWEIRRRVGVVFQNPDNQLVATTVRDDIAFGLENLGIEREEMKQRIQDSVSKVNMEGFLDHEPHRLSGGQKQRVAIAGILAMQPSIMILDEATSMLDPMGCKEVISTVERLNHEEGITLLSITHDLEEAIRADRIIVLNQGEIVKEGSPEEVFQNGEELIRLGLDLPFSIKLRQKLLEKGINISNSSLTQEELVNELWTLHLKM